MDAIDRQVPSIVIEVAEDESPNVLSIRQLTAQAHCGTYRILYRI
jgi:hypothetical protein